LPAPLLRVSTRVVAVDVIVRDHHGQIARGLTQDDFRVAEDGKPQKVDWFHAFMHGVTPTAANITEAHAGAGSIAASQKPPQDEPDAVIIILFDMLDISPPNQAFAKTQMLKFLAALPPGHEIALFVLTDRLRMLQNFTANSDLLAQAAHALQTRSSPLFQSASAQMQATDVVMQLQGLPTPGGEDQGTNVDIAQERLTEDFQHNQVRNELVNNAFRQLAQSSAVFTGRKNLFWLAESFPSGAITTLQSLQLSQGSPVFLSSPASQGANARMISGSQIAVYPISVLGLETTGINATLNGKATAPHQGGQMQMAGIVPSGADPQLVGSVGEGQAQTQMNGTLSQQGASLDALRDQLNAIAAATGGEAFVGTNDLAGALRHSLEGGENYYRLFYTPTDNNWNGKFRKIRVEVAHKGYTLNYRQGYFAVPDSDIKAG
jgi:VWFA-related protein